MIELVTSETVAHAMFYWLARGDAPGWWKYDRATTKREFLNRFPKLQNIRQTNYNRYGQQTNTH